MKDIEIFGNTNDGLSFIQKIEKKDFLFSLVISYTETCEIPGITVAGANPEMIKYTPAADAEFLRYGYCKSINGIPVTPDGKPTPALLTKVALDTANIPQLVINAGSKIAPKLSHIDLGLEYGKNIEYESALDPRIVKKAVEIGRTVGKSLGTLTNCLIIGESIPGGTTTALGVLTGFGLKGLVSSSMPQNPIELKNKVISLALKRIQTTNPSDIISQFGDPMIPSVAGMLSTASEHTNVILAGGTQMAAVLAFAKSLGFNKKNTAIGTTSYITKDNTANMIALVKQIVDVPIIVSKMKLGESKIAGLRAYDEGFVKEGAGAGGASIACMIKKKLDAKDLLLLTEKEYKKVISQ